MIYVALLRGINVGGKAKVEMPRLKEVFEKAGCKNVKTYINSGNVVFEDSRKSTELVLLLEAAIEKEFNLKVPLVIKDFAAVQQVLETIPKTWMNDTEQRSDVIFFRDEIKPQDIKEACVYKPDREKVLFIGNSVAWNIARENVTRGSMTKIIGHKLYPFLTIRNLNTVRKLHEIMSGY